MTTRPTAQAAALADKIEAAHFIQLIGMESNVTAEERELLLTALRQPQPSGAVLREALNGYADSYRSMSKMGDGKVDARSVEEDLRRNIIPLALTVKAAPVEGQINELAAWLIALEDASMYEPVPTSLVDRGRRFIHTGLTEKHSGDCTHESHSCVACSTSNAIAKAKQILAAMPAPRAVGDDALEKLISGFSNALLKKLRLAQANGRSGWDRDDWEKECQQGLLRHIEKGDPRDVAAYCVFIWHHDWITVPASPDLTALQSRADGSKT